MRNAKSENDLKKPQVGIASMWYEGNTCNMHLLALSEHVKKGVAKLERDCDIMVDQMRSIDNIRFKQRLGKLNAVLILQLKENIRIVLDL